MDTYTVLRALADSWVLLVMFGFFVGAALWAWRPGSAPLHQAASQIPFDHDDGPARIKDPQA